MRTLSEATALYCPLIRDKCVGTQCAAWAWYDPEGYAYRDTLYPTDCDSDAEEVEVGAPEPTPRPPQVPADWEWEPATEDGDGGCWVEPVSSMEARVAEKGAKRRGQCNAFGARR